MLCIAYAGTYADWDEIITRYIKKDKINIRKILNY